jgi:hypothetical protein
LNVTLIGKEVHQEVPDALSRICENHMPANQVMEDHEGRPVTLSALQPKQSIPDEIYDKIAAVYSSSMDHWGQRLTRKRINNPSITDQMNGQFIR